MCLHTSKTTEGVVGCAEQPFILQSMVESGRGRKHCVDLPLEGGGGTHLTSDFVAWQYSRNIEKYSKAEELTLADLLRCVDVLEGSRKSVAPNFCYRHILYG